MRHHWHLLFCPAIVIGCVLCLGGCGDRQGPEESSETLVVFHAGSLSMPFRELSQLFEQQHPGVKVLAEAAGSRDTARKVSDLGRPCDVLGSADYRVVDNLLMPEHALFNIRFALNEMAIAYTKRSNLADQINRDNWSELLLRPDVFFGRADPDSDPCGYRTLMVFQLAEKHLNDPGLADKLQAKHNRRYIRPKATELLALLESSEIDYLFIYRSVAKQHGLELLTLPDEVNLKVSSQAELYRQAVVNVSGKRPGQKIARTGEPIVYSVTIPTGATNRQLAVAYVQLLLSPQGRAVMAHNGQQSLVPALADGFEHLPNPLKSHCIPASSP